MLELEEAHPQRSTGNDNPGLTNAQRKNLKSVASTSSWIRESGNQPEGAGKQPEGADRRCPRITATICGG
ncbi:hypothetical protein [Pseudomonas phage PIP]|nr:hypothetical protein [Pseudomonas phage PIP]